jgi:hypothetical protein
VSGLRRSTRRPSNRRLAQVSHVVSATEFMIGVRCRVRPANSSFPFSHQLRNRGAAAEMFRRLWFYWENQMYSGRAQQNGFTTECRALGGQYPPSGLCAPSSDTMERGTCVHLSDAKIPCFRPPYKPEHFLLCNQSVAAGAGHRSRQLKSVHASSENGGRQMATLSHSGASTLTVFYFWIPTDSTRRLHG